MRNKYGYESIWDEADNQRLLRAAMGAPAPRIPYLLWPIAIVGALLFAHAVNVMWSRR